MDYSKIILRGRVESDPFIQSEPGRDCRATFRMEVRSRAAHKERVDVHNVVAFGRVAESCRFLKRGRTVTVEGRPQNFKFGDAGEKERAECVAEKIVFEEDGPPPPAPQQDEEKAGKVLFRSGPRSENW
jgi:single-stranded DNA-binding protein